MSLGGSLLTWQTVGQLMLARHGIDLLKLDDLFINGT